MLSSVARIGIIAGNGKFPFLALQGARDLGHEVTVIAIKEEAFPDLEASARKRTQPSCASSQAERSVASGAARELPMKGSRRNVEKLAISSPTASATACWRPPRETSVSEGSSRLVRTRE